MSAKTPLAYFDSHFTGMVPCRLLRFERGLTFFDRHTLLAVVQYTADRGPYRKGDIESWNAPYVIPRNRVTVHRNGRATIAAYDWADYVDIPPTVDITLPLP